MLLRLLRMKGLVTPWLLIATGIRIFFLNFVLTASSKKYPDGVGEVSAGVTTNPWELYIHQLSDLRS